MLLNVFLIDHLFLNTCFKTFLHCRPRRVHLSLLSEGALHGATAQTQVGPWATNCSEYCPAGLHKVKFFKFCYFLDQEGKDLRVPILSRSFWKKNRSDRFPQSSSCWTHPVCQVTSSLKRWAHAPPLESSLNVFIKFLSLQSRNPNVAFAVHPTDAVPSNGSHATVRKQV